MVYGIKIRDGARFLYSGGAAKLNILLFYAFYWRVYITMGVSRTTALAGSGLWEISEFTDSSLGLEYQPTSDWSLGNGKLPSNHT